MPWGGYRQYRRVCDEWYSSRVGMCVGRVARAMFFTCYPWCYQASGCAVLLRGVVTRLCGCVLVDTR